MAATSAPRTWLNQFGADYAISEELLALVNTGALRDISWGNDACPSFAITEDKSALLWVEHPDPRQRECASPRFSVVLYDEDGDWLDDPVSTERLPELLAYLKDHWDIG